MAYLKWTTCSCGKVWQGVDGGDILCHECRTKDDADKREKHFAELDALTLEERIRRVEEWIYNYRPPVHPNDMMY